jgi:hypothetical protein
VGVIQWKIKSRVSKWKIKSRVSKLISVYKDGFLSAFEYLNALNVIIYHLLVWHWSHRWRLITWNDLDTKEWSVSKHELELQLREISGIIRIPGYTGGGIRCQGGVSIPCWSITPALSPVPWSWMQSYPLSKSVCQVRSNYWLDKWYLKTG